MIFWDAHLYLRIDRMNLNKHRIHDQIVGMGHRMDSCSPQSSTVVDKLASWKNQSSSLPVRYINAVLRLSEGVQCTPCFLFHRSSLPRQYCARKRVPPIRSKKQSDARESYSVLARTRCRRVSVLNDNKSCPIYLTSGCVNSILYSAQHGSVYGRSIRLVYQRFHDI